MAKKLSIGCIGCGYWGPNLIRNFNSIPDCEIRTVCDASEERLEHMRSLYRDVRTVTDYRQIIDDEKIDAVIIATPIRTHYNLARESLLAGKHTFVEKPLAASVAECEELCQLARENGLILMVGHTFIYTPAVRYIKSLIDNGELGEIYSIQCSRLNLGLFQKDINVAWDLAPHDLSIILYILNETPKAVNCQGKAHINPGLEDVTCMTLDFESGAFATVQSSWLDPNKIRKMTIVGSKRMVVYDDIESQEKIKMFDKRVETPPHYDTFGEFQYSYHYGDINIPYIRQVEPLRIECQHFLDCINKKTTCDSSCQDGTNVVRILEAASESLEQGGARILLDNQYALR